MSVPSRKPSGFAAFSLIWTSQLFSILTSGMTGFALTVWMYENTKSVTAMAMVQVCFILPFMLMSFFAGPMIDRYSRRLMMAVSDSASAVGTVAVMIAWFLGAMEPWMLYAAAVLMGLGNAFQWPAFSATISLMVPKERLGKVNGMMSLLEAGPAVFAPILAGVLLPVLGVAGIMALDTVTFLFAVGTLFLVEIPDPERSAEGEKAKGTLVSEAIWGFTYIFKRPSLLGLQLMFLAGNFFSGFAGTVMAPMVLARTGTDALAFGGVQTVAALGGVAGALVMSAWGGFKRRSTGVITGWALMGLAGVALGLGSGFWAWSIAMALIAASSPLVNASNQSIWQSKVPPDLQGRVFSARRMIAFLSGPIVPLVAGPLADRVLEPAMRSPGSALGSLLGPVFGNVPGSGMSLLIFLSALAVVAVAALGWGVPAIRNVERLLPDWTDIADAAGAAGAAVTGEAGEAVAAVAGEPESA